MYTLSAQATPEVGCACMHHCIGHCWGSVVVGLWYCIGELKTRDWKTREWIGYGKPIKPKQPTHFRR